MTIIQAIQYAMQQGRLPHELQDLVSSPEGCAGLDEWLHADVIAALDTMGKQDRRDAIESLHSLAAR